MDYATSILARIPGITARRDYGLQQLMKKLQTYMTDEQLAVVAQAYEFGEAAHSGQKRMTGEPYITHPVAVAQILADMHLDAQAIAAAILHDVVEDTSSTIGSIETTFGSEIAALVDGVSKLDQIQFNSRAEAQAESFRKMLLAMVDDIRVILVKLADRLHNMRTMDAMPRDKQARIARETLDIYAPIANRLGINHIKTALEDLGLRHLYPFRYRVLEKSVRKAAGNQRQMVKRISGRINRALEAASIEAQVAGRQKHLYGIYRKMAEKRRMLSEIVDVYGFRIIANDVDTCYRILGIVHGLYKPVPGRFKDYIAIPRINGYQSLHTTLFGPNGLPLEVQIRTVEMHRVAESGVAAHWQYKADSKTDATPQRKAREWLSRLIEIQQSENTEEFMESVKVDLFPDKIYVFTPRGDILPLPKGATTVDFAYAVHTDVGNRCVAAKIDRQLVPLRTRLTNGQTVEIVTAKGAKPNPNWVNFVTTAKARSAIRNYMKNMRRSEAIDLGKRLLDKSLKDLDSSLRKIGKLRMAKAVKDLGLKDADTLYEQLGLGERLAQLTAGYLLGTDESAPMTPRSSVSIAGTEGMVVSYAKCCHPLPGDEVMGYLSSGRGIVIHRNVCGNLSKFRKQPEKWLNVNWEKSIQREFSSQIQVETESHMGVLAEVAATIADAGSNIEQVSVLDRHEDCSVITFVLQVRDRNHLARVLRGIRNMKSVLRVSRDCA
ncbi:MAG TPA: bifunctional (p)ppGpp synthetase/guanosine-3',5'-bis(diphosphate) 3'-pyrophosphohydrolase [Woeseiaceae bacterium]